MSMTKLHAIYVLLDETQNVFYVGKTNNPNTRLRRHLWHVCRGSQYPVHNKLRKVLETVDKKDVYKVIEHNIPENEIDDREIFYIKSYRDKGTRLKNLTSGGEGGKGYTPEIQKRAAKKRRGIPKSFECKKRISETKKGVPLSVEHKVALKNAWKSRKPFDAEHYKKISQMNRGVINIKKYEVLSPDGEVYITHRGLTDFCRDRGLSSSNLYKTFTGTRPHHKGWKILCEVKKGLTFSSKPV